MFGGNQNFAAYVRNGVGKHEAPSDIIPREEGQWQGGVSVVVGLGICFRGMGTFVGYQRGGGVEPPCGKKANRRAATTA